jgi:hypothetical protein
MQLVSDRSKSVRARVEVQGRWTRVSIELRDVPRAERERLRTTVEGFAAGLWARFAPEDLQE